CTAAIELRESANLQTAATIGWTKPVILLPHDWHGWTADERRVVLAHEIAHVRRGDYAVWIGAQVVLAAHFYNPVLHWLANRLRLEQELAADALAAGRGETRRTYLTTLADLALRQADRPATWPARAFLPLRGTFLRRIEMLRDSQTLWLTHPSWPRRCLPAGALALAALLLAGLRPSRETPLVAAERTESPRVAVETAPPVVV